MMPTGWKWIAIAVVLVLAGVGAINVLQDPAPEKTAVAPEPTQLPEHPPEAEIALIEHVEERWTGDFDGMEERGFLRVLTAYSLLGYFLDGGKELGLVKEATQAFSKHLNKGRPRGGPRVDVVIIPVPRDQLIPKLLAGEGDLIAANLTITTARNELVDFSMPWLKNVKAILVTGPAAGKIDSFEDLAAVGGVHLRRSSSYYEHMVRRNTTLQNPVPITPADEMMEDGDLLEMVDAGLIPAIIMDDHKADFWAQFFDNITVHPTKAVDVGGEIAWAMRKGSPLLKAKVDEFMRTIRKGSLLGNILLKKYYTERTWIESPRGAVSKERFEKTAPLIQRYAELYDFDWLLIAAQAFQESRLDHDERSHKGAVGIMQVLPTTAKDKRVELPNVEDLETNIHAGVKYLRVLRDGYFTGPEYTELDSALFALAAYNAGARNIARAQKHAKKMSLDPHTWFGNVELAAARAISREPVVYVRNIYKYYLAYRNTELVTAAR